MHRVAPNTGGRRIALLVFLLSPLLVLALLFFLIWQAQRTGLADRKAPVGAGAGQTGMSNEHSGIHLGK